VNLASAAVASCKTKTAVHTLYGAIEVTSGHEQIGVENHREDDEDSYCTFNATKVSTFRPKDFSIYLEWRVGFVFCNCYRLLLCGHSLGSNVASPPELAD